MLKTKGSPPFSAAAEYPGFSCGLMFDEAPFNAKLEKSNKKPESQQEPSEKETVFEFT